MCDPEKSDWAQMPRLYRADMPEQVNILNFRTKNNVLCREKRPLKIRFSDSRVFNINSNEDAKSKRL